MNVTQFEPESKFSYIKKFRAVRQGRPQEKATTATLPSDTLTSIIYNYMLHPLVLHREHPQPRNPVHSAELYRILA